MANTLPALIEWFCLTPYKFLLIGIGRCYHIKRVQSVSETPESARYRSGYFFRASNHGTVKFEPS